MNAAIKIFVELTGNAGEAAFHATRRSDSSYMAVMSVANSLMLDFRCVVITHAESYATGAAFGAMMMLTERLRSRRTDRRTRQ